MTDPVRVRRAERAVRVATIAAIAITCLSVASLFLPTGELAVRQATTTTSASRSLYDLGKSTGEVRSFIDAYRASAVKRLGARALDRVAPHLSGRLGERAAEVQEAVAILDGIEDRHIDTAGKVMAGTLWTVISLHVLLILLLVGTDAGTGRARVVITVIVAVLNSMVALGVYVALDRIVTTANAELARNMFALRSGAYLLPVAAAVALAAVTVVAITHGAARRRRRELAALPPPAYQPPPPPGPSWPRFGPS